MPELPDITVYVEALERFAVGQRLLSVKLKSPFLLRSVEPPIESVQGRGLTTVERLGKRIVFGFETEIFLVLHLMIAGRLRWRETGSKVGQKTISAVFEFDNGLLVLSEAGSKKRASLHAVGSREELTDHNPGGYEVLMGDPAGFAAALTRENRTLKRALTDPRILSGIGNAYSDEILHHARLSPFKLSQQLDEHEVDRLHSSCIEVLKTWTERLRGELGDGFPEKVTAFHDEMAVHGRYRQPCPVCGKAVQRIVYAQNESNYCAQCQTGGRLLADRALSRLLKKDWPKTVDELEQERMSSASRF